MNVLKIIFTNSVIYKIFLALLVMYKNSYLKRFCDGFVNIYKNSRFYKKVQKYLNSTPVYKYSFIKKINEKIYLFVVNHSKFLYDFVYDTFINSFFVDVISSNAKKVKNDKLKTSSLFLSIFFFAFAISKYFLTHNSLYLIVFAIVGIFFVLIYVMSNALKRVFYNSFLYNLIINLLKVEVSNEID